MQEAPCHEVAVQSIEHAMTLQASQIGGARRISHLPKHTVRFLRARIAQFGTIRRLKAQAVWAVLAMSPICHVVLCRGFIKSCGIPGWSVLSSTA